jgi:glutamate dehydrogenase (NAD(P)+)
MTERPYLEVVWNDPASPARGFAVIDTLVGGVASGGLRMRAGCTLQEVRELAAAMTVKEAIAFDPAAAYRPFGGAKGGIDHSPYAPDAREVLARYLTAMRPLLADHWAVGEDLGVQQATLNEICAQLGLRSSIDPALRRLEDPAAGLDRVAAAFAVTVDGISLGDLVGGHGVAVAALTALAHLGRRPDRATAAIQGFGSIGGAAARYLAAAGVRVVAVTDIQGTISAPRGLDIERLLATRDSQGTIDRRDLDSAAMSERADEWLHREVDLIVPAAVSNAITPDNCDAIRAPLVVEAANVATTPDAQRRLTERGVVIVPDVIANLATNAWWWWTLFGDVAPDAAAAFARIQATIRRLVTEVLERRDRSAPAIPTRALAAQMAAELVAVAETDSGASVRMHYSSRASGNRP